MKSCEENCSEKFDVAISFLHSGDVFRRSRLIHFDTISVHIQGCKA